MMMGPRRDSDSTLSATLPVALIGPPVTAAASLSPAGGARRVPVPVSLSLSLGLGAAGPPAGCRT